MDWCVQWRRERRHTVISQKERRRRECEKSMTLLSSRLLVTRIAHWRAWKGAWGREHSKRVHSSIYGTLISCERLSNPCFGNRIKAKPRKFLSPDTAKYELCFWESFWFQKIFFVRKQSLWLPFSPKLKIFQLISFDPHPKTCWNLENLFLSLRLNQVE